MDSPQSDWQDEQHDFQKMFDHRYDNEQFNKSNNIMNAQQSIKQDTLQAIVKNIKIDKQIAGKKKKRQKIHWNKKNTDLFLKLFTCFSGNLDQILLYFQQNNELRTEIDIKQIKNKYKIEKKKNTLNLSKEAVTNIYNFDLKLDIQSK